MKILVTGGAGYVGSCLIPVLLQNHSVRVLDNITYGNHGILPYIRNPQFEFINGDIRKVHDIKTALKQVDFVIHLAAIVGYPACNKNPQLAHQINYLSTKKIVHLCSCPIIFASTGSCYGSVKRACTEDSSLHPLTTYAITKIKAEEAIKTHRDYIIYRFSTGFGVSPRLRLDLLVNDFVYQALKYKTITLYEKDFWRSFIHVQDIVQSYLFAITHFEDIKGEIFNVGSDQLCLTKEQVALTIQKYLPFSLHFTNEGKDLDKRNYVVSFNKIKAVGYTPQMSLDDGIQELIQALTFIQSNDNHYNDRIIQVQTMKKK